MELTIAVVSGLCVAVPSVIATITANRKSSPLTSIDFISDDETFIYLTKEYDNLEVGKYYTITQKLKVE